MVYISLRAGFKKLKKSRNSKSKHQIFIEKAKENGCVTMAQVVDAKWENGDWDSNISELRNPTMTVKYKYIVNEKEYFTYLTFQSPGRQRIKYPITLEAYYDPKDPTKVDFEITENEKQRVQSGCLSAIGTTIAIFAAIGIFGKLIGIVP